jgi:hypothetical protein
MYASGSGDGQRSGWRKRQVLEMAREAGFEGCAELTWEGVICTEELERFAALVRADEREACAEVCKKHADVYAGLEQNPTAQSAWAACIDNRDTILARGQA